MTEINEHQFLPPTVMPNINKLQNMNYDKKKYKIWDWKSPVILHWIINPGLVINELILG
jgi:hypothetical protein